MNILDDEEKIELSTRDISKLVAKLKDMSNAAWAAAQSLRMIVKASEGMEKALKLMHSPQTKKEPGKEAQESLNAWLGEDDI